MEDVRFDQPVFIVTGRPASVLRKVATTAEACHYLLNQWPAGKAAGKHLAARRACAAVLEGKRKAALARKAFAEAAEEAGVLVDPKRL